MAQVKGKNIVIGMDNSFSMIRYNDVRVSSNVWAPGKKAYQKSWKNTMFPYPRKALTD